MVLIASIAGWIEDFPYLYMHANKMNSGNYLLFYPTALAGIIMTNNIFKILCERIIFRVLEYIGVNAMNFYVTHWILFTVVLFAAKYFFNIESPFEQFILLLGASIILLPLIVEIIKANSKALSPNYSSFEFGRFKIRVWFLVTDKNDRVQTLY